MGMVNISAIPVRRCYAAMNTNLGVRGVKTHGFIVGRKYIFL